MMGLLNEQMNGAAAASRPLQDRIRQIDHIQSRRFSKLAGDCAEIATEGIIRHLRACAYLSVNPDASAVREIIDDAKNGRRVFAETEPAQPSVRCENCGRGLPVEIPAGITGRFFCSMICDQNGKERIQGN